MSHATNEANKLLEVCLAEYEHLKKRIADVSKAIIATRDNPAADLEEIMNGAISLTDACDELSKMADIMHKAIDKALLRTLDETRGGENYSNGKWTIFAAQSSYVEIPEPSAVPPLYMKPMEPDKQKIKSLIKQTSVNWASLAPGKRYLGRRALNGE